MKEDENENETAAVPDVNKHTSMMSRCGTKPSETITYSTGSQT